MVGALDPELGQRAPGVALTGVRYLGRKSTSQDGGHKLGWCRTGGVSAKPGQRGGSEPFGGRVNLSAWPGVGQRTLVCRLVPMEGGFFARWVGRSWGLGEAQMDGRSGFIGGAVVSVGDRDV